MSKDIEQELDTIFAHHKARVAQARDEAAGKSAAVENFGQAAAVCLASVIVPALEQMARALNERGVAATAMGVIRSCGRNRIARPGGSASSETPPTAGAAARWATTPSRKSAPSR